MYDFDFPLEVSDNQINLFGEDNFITQVWHETRRQVTALGDDWANEEPADIAPTIEVEISEDESLVWRLFQKNWHLSPLKPHEFEDAWDFARSVANWVFDELLMLILNRAYERGTYVTLETGEVGKPGYIQTTYRLTDKKAIDVRNEITAEMVNQLVRGGWKVVR